MKNVTGKVVQKGKSHPVVWSGYALILVGVCRLTESIPALSMIPLGKICFVVAFGLLLFGPRNRLSSLKTSIGSRGMMTFSVLVVISGAYSIWYRASFEFLTEVFIFYAFMYVVLAKSIRSIREVRIYSSALIVGSVAFVVSGILTTDWTQRVEVESAFDQNDLALFLVVVLPLVFVERSLAKRKIFKVAFLGLMLAMLLLIALTQSRGGFLALLVLVVYWINSGSLTVTKAKHAGRRRLRKSILAFLAALPLIALIPESAVDRLLTLTTLSSDYNVASDREGRLAIWSRGLTYLMSHPQGAGVGTYQVVDMKMGGQFRSPHNSFVQIFVEVGVIGGAVYTYIIVSLIKLLSGAANRLREFRDPRRIEEAELMYAYAKGLLGSMIAFIVAGFFLSMGYSGLLFTLIALSGSLIFAIDKAIESAEAGSE